MDTNECEESLVCKNFDTHTCLFCLRYKYNDNDDFYEAKYK